MSQDSAFRQKLLKGAHFGRDAAFAVYEFGKSCAGDTECGGGVGDGQIQGLNALAQHEAAGVGWVLRRHGFSFPVCLY